MPEAVRSAEPIPLLPNPTGDDMRTAWMTMTALLTAGASAQLAEKLDLGVRVPAEGLRYEVEQAEMVTQTFAAQEEGGASSERVMRGTVEVVFKITPAEPEGEAEKIPFSIEIERLVLSDSTTGEDGQTVERSVSYPPAEEADEASQAFAEALGGVRFVVHTDPEGQEPILSVVGEIVQARTEAMRELGASSISASFLRPGSMLGLIKPVFTADGAAPAQRAGFGWESPEEIELPPIAVMNLRHAYKLGEPNNEGDVLIAGTLEGDLLVTPSDSSMSPTIELRELTGESELMWNVDHGHLRTRERSKRIVTGWTLGVNRMEQVQETSSSISILMVE